MSKPIPQLVLILGAALLIAGCDLFATRDPENPVNAGSLYEPPTTPTIVLRNLENALAYANSGDYRKCFSDPTKELPAFVFDPSIQGISAAPATFSHWGIVEEEEYARNLFAELQQGELASVVFSPSEVLSVPIGDSVQFTANYEARFPHTRQGAEREAAGSVQMTMRRSRQNEWYITYWHDISTDNRTSWSLVKARFISQ